MQDEWKNYPFAVEIRRSNVRRTDGGLSPFEVGVKFPQEQSWRWRLLDTTSATAAKRRARIVIAIMMRERSRELLEQVQRLIGESLNYSEIANDLEG